MNHWLESVFIWPESFQFGNPVLFRYQLMQKRSIKAQRAQSFDVVLPSNLYQGTSRLKPLKIQAVSFQPQPQVGFR